jgi:hypothetical protein
MKVCLLVFLFSAMTYAASSPDSAARANLEAHAVRLTEHITVDGILSESVWQTDEGISAFTQSDPIENADPTERTVVHVAYDDAAVYIGARMYDRSPDSIVARLGRRDDQNPTDAFYVGIDAENDRRSGVYFGVNPAGTLYDGILYNDDWSDNSWDGVWEAKARIDSLGWTAEMRIPYSQLRFHKTDLWKVNFRRDIARKHETDCIVFTPKNGSGFVSRFIPLRGIENIDPPAQVEVLPYVTTRAEYSQVESGDPYHTGKDYSPGAGVDMKIGLGNDLKLNASINPDFGQVEVDPAIVNLSDVETYFTEKRPFFTEGNNIFDYGHGGIRNNWSFNWSSPTMFYSRRIGRDPQGALPGYDYADLPDGTHIIGAAKLTGKIDDDLTIGTIQAVTSRELATVDSAGQQQQLEVEPLTYYGVARALKQYDNGKEGLGVFTTLTERRFGDANMSNQINSGELFTGLDGWTALDDDKSWVVAGAAGFSEVNGSKESMTTLQEDAQHYYQRPDSKYLHLDTNATSMDGAYGRFYLVKQKGNFFWNSALGIITPGFEINDMGYLSRADVINMHAGGGYSWVLPTDWYRQLSLMAALFRNYDFDGDITSHGVYSELDWQTLNFFWFGLNYAYNPPSMSATRTRGGPLMETPPGNQFNFTVSSDPNKPLIWYAGAFTYQSFYSRSSSYWASAEWHPASQFMVSFNPEFDIDHETSQYVGTFADPLATATYGNRYVFGAMNNQQIVAAIRLNWIFNPNLSLQTYFQPLVATAHYADFKEFAKPRTYAFNHYGTDNGSTISYDPATTTYTVDPDGNGPAPAFSFSNPDFDLLSLRGNAVLRWEYSPGSVIYFVWTQTRSEQDTYPDYQFNHSVVDLLDPVPDNVFLVKFSYWWNM